MTGHVDPGRVAPAGGFALGGAAAQDLLPRVARYLGPFNGAEHQVHGQFPPKHLPREQINGLLEWLDTHNGSPPHGWPGGTVYKNIGSDRLPKGAHREYDLATRPPTGQQRDSQRVIIDAATSAVYYTDSHYHGFRRVR